jgi:hypothetical protein
MAVASLTAALAVVVTTAAENTKTKSAPTARKTNGGTWLVSPFVFVYSCLPLVRAVDFRFGSRTALTKDQTPASRLSSKAKRIAHFR